jgi:hypothetical protein
VIDAGCPILLIDTASLSRVGKPGDNSWSESLAYKWSERDSILMLWKGDIDIQTVRYSHWRNKEKLG